MSAPLNHPRTAHRQGRRENGSGQRVLVRAMVTPEVAANVRALAQARNVSMAMILSEALAAKFSGSRL
jgi:hypothetical protein